MLVGQGRCLECQVQDAGDAAGQTHSLNCPLHLNSHHLNIAGYANFIVIV